MTIYERAIAAYGQEAQIKMLFEEMAELQLAVCKNGCGKDNADYIAEEIADVEIMLAQMKLIFDCEREVELQGREKREESEKHQKPCRRT